MSNRIMLAAVLCIATSAHAQAPTEFYNQFERKPMGGSPKELRPAYERPAYRYPKESEPLGVDGLRHCSPTRASFYSAMRIREAKQRHYVESRESRIAADPSLADPKSLLAKNMALVSGRLPAEKNEQPSLAGTKEHQARAAENGRKDSAANEARQKLAVDSQRPWVSVKHRTLTPELKRDQENWRPTLKNRRTGQPLSYNEHIGIAAEWQLGPPIAKCTEAQAAWARKFMNTKLTSYESDELWNDTAGMGDEILSRGRR